jgi:hypothetical protein
MNTIRATTIIDMTTTIAGGRSRTGGVGTRNGDAGRKSGGGEIATGTMMTAITMIDMIGITAAAAASSKGWRTSSWGAAEIWAASLAVDAEADLVTSAACWAA